jgi:predicted dehydrogenase
VSSRREPQPLRVGIVGHGFMGRAHALGWSRARQVANLPLEPYVAVLCGRDTEAVAASAERLGVPATCGDWRELIQRDDIDLIDICTPGSTHGEIAVAALEAGKHTLCEKPLANNMAEAKAMASAAAAAAEAGVASMVGFNYRLVPALALARSLVSDGRLGAIRHVRASYLQDWLVDPSFPLTWRLQAGEAGSGALGDLGSHLVDLAQYLTGKPIISVLGLTETFVRERPLPGRSVGLAATASDGAITGQVSVDDAAAFVARFEGGAIGTFEASRMATGNKNALHVELNGERGSVVFDLERLNELQVYELDATGGGFARVLATEPSHPFLNLWWPPGHVLGWEHTFVHEMVSLVEAIAAGRQPEPSFADGLAVQAILQAVGESSNSGGWASTLVGV